MALNKLKTGVAFSSQVPEQNANLDEIERRLTEGENRVLHANATGSSTIDLNSYKKGSGFYLLYVGVGSSYSGAGGLYYIHTFGEGYQTLNEIISQTYVNVNLNDRVLELYRSSSYAYSLIKMY